MNGRIYDPLLGRFLSADPYIPYINYSQSYNRYSYVLNNPLVAEDSTGYLPDFLNDFFARLLGITQRAQESAYEEELEENAVRSDDVDGEIPPQASPVDVVSDNLIWGLIDGAAVVVGYVSDSGEQVLLGEFSDKVTLLGTSAQIITGLVGADLPADIRDTVAAIVEFVENPSLSGGVLVVLNAGAALPVVGVLKYSDEVVVVVRRSKYPEAAKHIEDAQNAGHPSILTVNRGGANKNRPRAQKGHTRVPGKQLDEYPPAMFEEGGEGASIRPIDPRDNMGAGASMGSQLLNVPDGTKVKIVVVD